MAYVTTSTVSGEIRYRFTCEQCGKTCEWVPIRITRKASANGSGESASAAAQEAAQKAVKARFAEIKKDVDAGDYASFRVVNGGEDESLFRVYECPDCGAIQSWGVRSAGKKFGVPLLVTLLLLGCYLAFFLLGNNLFPETVETVRTALRFWRWLIVPIVLVVGWTVDGAVVRAQTKKRLAQQTMTEKRLPEIDWNGMIGE
ncbi:MAG: hypothetical protein K6G17_01880 [Oscillospiraceae bacterium]|nr:hypothetical protein [Oscillospiraceae bacterium]